MIQLGTQVLGTGKENRKNPALGRSDTEMRLRTLNSKQENFLLPFDFGILHYIV